MKFVSQQWRAGRQLIQSYQRLHNNLSKAQSAFKTATKAIHELQRSIHRYNFKSQPALQKITHILKKGN
ncbi:hypothetical protein [uncultured Limosilactobacillus sp.]|uniref:hypothetical protein n=1 Tax=uncultured Limosilactobacillus sp. TaxID=2837629 RepID=UPI0025F465D5|nr:hypothetical protein [uncultured Limosilactobacillus sp.]